MSELAANAWILLLGRRDEPTDGVRDYCRYLSDALAQQGVQTTEAEMRWAERGWIRSLGDLWKSARNWKGRWVLFQYTPLAWSRHGFPFGALAVVAVLRLRGARTAVVFHDWSGYTGPRFRDRIRWRCQLVAMRRMAKLAERSTMPVPPERAGWLQSIRVKVDFIAIGANLPPAPANPPDHPAHSERLCPTVAVFSMTEGQRGVAEARVIAAAVKTVAARVGRIRLVVLGRGSQESRPAFQGALDGAPVELSVLGLLAAEEIAHELSRADAALFVRGEILSQRGSAIASVACGTPLVGFGRPERAFPLSDAGVVFVPRGDVNMLGEALSQVLTDNAFRQELRKRNQRAQAEYFSWQRIAQKFVQSLGAN